MKFTSMTILAAVMPAVNACLEVNGRYAVTVAGVLQNHVSFVDDGVEVCRGSCQSYRECNLECNDGYSGRLIDSFERVIYSTPHGDFNVGCKPDVLFNCCMWTPDGACSNQCSDSRLHAKYWC